MSILDVFPSKLLPGVIEIDVVFQGPKWAQNESQLGPARGGQNGADDIEASKRPPKPTGIKSLWKIASRGVPWGVRSSRNFGNRRGIFHAEARNAQAVRKSWVWGLLGTAFAPCSHRIRTVFAPYLHNTRMSCWKSFWLISESFFVANDGFRGFVATILKIRLDSAF